MFIVDMNRKITVNVDNVICITQEAKRITAVTKVDDIILGTYSTEESAAEVYENMLKNIFSPNFIVTGESEIGEPEANLYDCGVYYMQEE